MARNEIRDLSDDLPDAAGALLADRHRAHRRREPALDARYEAPALARAEIPQSWLATLPPARRRSVARPSSATSSVPGVIPRCGGRTCGSTWPATPRRSLRRCASCMAPPRAAGSTTAGRITASSSRRATRCCSARGSHSGSALSTCTPSGRRPVRSSGPRCHPGSRSGARMLPIPEPSLSSSRLADPQRGRAGLLARPIPTFEEALAEIEGDAFVDDSRYTTFVAVRDGRVIGCAIGTSIHQSNEHSGMARPPGAAFLGYAAVLPEARGLGQAGRWATRSSHGRGTTSA